MESRRGLNAGRENLLDVLAGRRGPHTLDELVGELSPPWDKPGHGDYYKSTTT
jgi:hypothetical protein